MCVDIEILSGPRLFYTILSKAKIAADYFVFNYQCYNTLLTPMKMSQVITSFGELAHLVF